MNDLRPQHASRVSARTSAAIQRLVELDYALGNHVRQLRGLIADEVAAVAAAADGPRRVPSLDTVFERLQRAYPAGAPQSFLKYWDHTDHQWHNFVTCRSVDPSSGAE